MSHRVHPSAELPSRAALLASGALEASSAAAIFTACIAQAATSTVWGVGPWEHDYVSLIDDPPPDEIASAVALAAGSGERALTAIGYTETPDLELRMPICLDVCPQTVDMLIGTLLEVLTDVLTIAEDGSTADNLSDHARECALMYWSSLTADAAPT